MLALFWRHSTSSGKQETLWNLNQQARTGQGSEGTLGAPSCHLPSMALGPPEVLHDLYDLGSSSFLSENGRPSFWVGTNKASKCDCVFMGNWTPAASLQVLSKQFSLSVRGPGLSEKFLKPSSQVALGKESRLGQGSHLLTCGSNACAERASLQDGTSQP